MFKKIILTNLGLEMVTKLVLGEESLEFTTIRTSNKDYSGINLLELTAIEDIKQEIEISKVEIASDTQIKINASINNDNLTESYYVKAIGIYGKNKASEEILFGIAIASEDEENIYIPAYDGVTQTIAVFDMTIEVGNSENVTITINAGATATMEDISKLEEKITNVEGDIETLEEKIETHVLSTIATEDGVHGIRYYNNSLEYTTDGTTWLSIDLGSESLDEIKTIVSNTYNIVNSSSYGNSPIYTKASNTYSIVNNSTYGNSPIYTKASNTYSIVNNSTYGNSAIKSAIDNIKEKQEITHFLDLPNLTYKTLSTGYEQKEQTTSRALSTLLSVSGAGYICFCTNSTTFYIKGTTCPVRYKLTVDGTVKLWLELTPCSSTTTLFRLMGYTRQLDVISGYFNEDLLGLGVLVGSAQDSTTKTKQILDFSSSKQSFYAINNASSDYGAMVAKFTKGLGIRFEKSFSFSANVGDWHVMYSLDD